MAGIVSQPNVGGFAIGTLSDESEREYDAQQKIKIADVSLGMF